MTRKLRDILVSVGVVVGCVIVIVAMIFLTGCASVPVVEDPCKDCPFTERPVPVWSPPDLPPVPPYPDLTAELFTADQITKDSAAYIQALIADHLTLKASVVEHHHWAESLVTAIKEAETTAPD